MDKMNKLKLSDITNSSLVIRTKVTLTVTRGDITDSKDDIIVHSTNQAIDLSQDWNGPVLVEKAGGHRLQEVCTDLAPIGIGDVKETNAFRLSCCKILYFICPPYEDEKTTKHRIMDIVSKCLMKVATNNYKSISFPAFRSGGEVQYQPESVAKWIIAATHDYCEMYPRSSLIAVRVVLRDTDQQTQTGFDNVMYGLMPSRMVDKHLTEVTSSSLVVGRRVKLTIVHSDISKSTDDVIVNSTTRDVDLTRGRVAPKLARVAGSQLQAACREIVPLGLGDVAETKGFKLACKILLHCNVPPYEDEITTKPKFKDIIRKCLTKVVTSRYRSISFPALGTGNLRYPPKNVAKWTIETIYEHCEMFTRSSLADVSIVIYERDTNTQEGFDSYMRSLVYKDVSDVHTLIYNRLGLDVTVGDLSMSIEETVAIPEGNDVVSNAVTAKAGSKYKDAWSNLPPFRNGSVHSTAGFGMHCKKILLYKCRPWAKTMDDTGLNSILKSCLVQAALEGHRSMALPTVGLGTEGYPPSVICRSISQVMAEYSEENPYSSLVIVKIYICPTQITVPQLEMFKWTFRMLGCQAQTDGYILANETVFTARSGDLADTKVDILVNSTGSHMSLSGGNVSLALLNKAGKALQEECTKHAPLILGDIVMTGGFGLPCTNVLHVCCPNWKTGESEKALRELIYRCLSWANDLNSESIAFPAIGTGLLKYPAESVARCLVHAASDFARTNPRSSLKKVMLVVYSKDVSTIEGVEETYNIELNPQEVKPTEETTTKIEDGKFIVDLPSPWSTPVNIYREVDVTKSGNPKEWKELVADFAKSLNRPTAVILKVTRVQNPTVYAQYALLKQSVARKLNKQEVEVEMAPLWHGTKEENVGKITRNKFDWRLSGDVGSDKLGKGSYFSTTTRYSSQDLFSPVNAKGERHMILARVITGDYCKGDSSLKTAPYKNKYEQYDSVVDDVSNPTMYAVFEDVGAYPEYIIKYRY